MDRFFDEAARILARPIPRRKAMRLIFGAMGGAIITAFTEKALIAAARCTCGSSQCQTTACPGSPSTSCCPSNGPEQVCCGTNACCKSTACCNTASGTCFSTNGC